MKEIRRSETWGILEQALILSTDAREVVRDGRCFDSSDSEKYHREIATDKGRCNHMTDGAGVRRDENPNARRDTTRYRMLRSVALVERMLVFF